MGASGSVTGLPSERVAERAERWVHTVARESRGPTARMWSRLMLSMYSIATYVRPPASPLSTLSATRWPAGDQASRTAPIAPTPRRRPVRYPAIHAGTGALGSPRSITLETLRPSAGAAKRTPFDTPGPSSSQQANSMWREARSESRRVRAGRRWDSDPKTSRSPTLRWGNGAASRPDIPGHEPLL